MFRDWLIAHPEDRRLYADAKRAAATALSVAGAATAALGAGMRYNRVKEPVVREIYQRMFRAAGLVD